MKKRLLIPIIVGIVVATYGMAFEPSIAMPIVRMLQPPEIDAITTGDEQYVFFGPEVGLISSDLLALRNVLIAHNIDCDNICMVCNSIEKGNTTAPKNSMKAALWQARQCIQDSSLQLTPEDRARFTNTLSDYSQKMDAGFFDISTPQLASDNFRNHCISKVYCRACADKIDTDCLLVKSGSIIRGNAVVEGNETVQKNLLVGGNSIVKGDLTVTGTVSIPPIFVGNIELVGNPQQACIIFVDNTLTEKARICSSSIPGDKGVFVSVDGGLTQNFRVNNAGGVVIATPSSGVALTVNGGETIASGDLDVTAGNIILPQANAGGTQGLLELGGTGATNVVMYEIGTRNLFAGNGAVNAGVTGTDNINIGTSANSSLTTANNTVAIGTSASAIGTDSISVGDSANTALAGAIVMGSRDSASSGVAPTVTSINGIAIGGANGTRAGAAANGISSIAIGGSDGTFAGASATGGRSIAVGVNATSPAARSITLGSASGVAGGTAPTVNAAATNAIAIGSANDGLAGANANSASATGSIAIGGSDGTFAGASATGSRSIAVGVNAKPGSANTIAIGSSGSGVAGGPSVSGQTGIAIGSANSNSSAAVCSGVAGVAIGGSDGLRAGAQAAIFSVSIGLNSRANNTSAISIGSASASAAGPNVTAANAIAIGSANGTAVGPTASAVASIAIGSQSISSLPRAVEIGVGAVASGPPSGAGNIAIGSSSGLSAPPLAVNNLAISIGSGNSTNSGAAATGTSAVAIGGASPTAIGASAAGTNSVAIGNGASTSQANAIVLGNSNPVGASPVRVGIGIDAPAAKLDVVGVDGTPVVILNQVNTAIGNAPVWPNPSTGPGPGIPIYYDNLNRLFGFTSSRRYKTNIRSIDSESAVIYALNPVTYDAKDGEGKNIAGFIAEEVFDVAPNLAVLNKEGAPANVAYSSIYALAVKEIQKHKQMFDKQKNCIDNNGQRLAVADAAIIELKKLLNEND